MVQASRGRAGMRFRLMRTGDEGSVSVRSRRSERERGAAGGDWEGGALTALLLVLDVRLVIQVDAVEELLPALPVADGLDAEIVPSRCSGSQRPCRRSHPPRMTLYTIPAWINLCQGSDTTHPGSIPCCWAAFASVSTISPTRQLMRKVDSFSTRCSSATSRSKGPYSGTTLYLPKG
jgi:hypothetical protein